MEKTAAVILNWNGLNYLKEFLPTVVEHSRDHAEIFIIDNASTDGSVDWIRAHFPKVGIIQNDKNFGFAQGYNEGLKHIEADLYILLNSDVLVTKNWIENTVKCMEEEQFDVCQPKILSHQFPNKFDHAGAAGGFLDKFSYPFCRGRILWNIEIDSGQYDNRCEIFWASGACFFIRAKLYHKMGGLDEHFFAHMEEIDLCWRLKNRGYKVGYCPESKVYHVGGGTLSILNPFKTFLNFRNNLYLITKNKHDGILFSNLFKRLALDGIAAVRFLAEAKFSSFLSVLKAHASFYRNLNGMLKKRRREISESKGSRETGWYRKGIIWGFFFKKIKRFSQIDPRDIE